MIFAAFAAIAQSNIKRLMAYSSIGHIGYILIGMACFNFEGVQSLIIYLIIYLVMNISVFSFILMMKRKDEYCENINDLSGLYKHNPFYAILIALSMFSDDIKNSKLRELELNSSNFTEGSSKYIILTIRK